MTSILIISFIPTHPPTSGNSARILKQVELLRELGHKVYFAFLSDGDSGDLMSMRKYWGEQLTVFPYHNPALPHLSFYERAAISICSRLRLSFFRWPELKSSYGIDDWYDEKLTPSLLKLTEIINPSAVIVEYVFFSKILEYIPDKISKFIDTHDIFSDRNARADSKWFSTSRAEEAKGLNRAHSVIAIQSNEAEFFRTITDRSIHTIGHFIEIVNLPEGTSNQAINIGYIGSQNKDNVTALQWFFEYVYPLLLKTNRKITFTLAGNVCKHLDNLPSTVKCIPYIDSLEKIYANADIMINPAQKGTGLKIKTVEALGYGKPLLTTSIGADGFLNQKGIAFELADSAQEFAEKLISLANNPQRRRELSYAAHDFSKTYNSQIKLSLQNIFD